MVRQFLQRTAAILACSSARGTSTRRAGTAAKRLLAIWIGSAMIITAAFAQPAVAGASETFACWLNEDMSSDLWCAMNAEAGMTSCGRCTYTDNQAEDTWAGSCGSDTSSCVYVPDYETCAIAAIFYCDNYVSQCEGLENCTSEPSSGG